MMILPTDKWLEMNINKPGEILKKIDGSLDDEKQFYKYLRSFGMYQPSRGAEECYKKLVEDEVWTKIQAMFKKYKKLWNGIDINIAILPIDVQNRGLMRETRGRSGIAFHDFIYLFFSPQKDDKEYESLFVHEYHHAVRLNHFKKEMGDYTLLDSLMFEGLAEHAVKEYCGKEYLAAWCHSRGEKQLEGYWEKWFKNKLGLKKDEQAHDDILFGRRGYPKLLGYSMGYYLVEQFKKENPFSTAKAIYLPPKKLLLKKFFTNG
ncbi:DUF2268 domain-containing protein [Falsibacillus pallidus]|uniref:DUF2268 domain-containing protein n=1 Tax=Falsibacillus pallidus TaxID=493781 RepID=UPI003D997439